MYIYAFSYTLTTLSGFDFISVRNRFVFVNKYQQKTSIVRLMSTIHNVKWTNFIIIIIKCARGLHPLLMFYIVVTLLNTKKEEEEERNMRMLYDNETLEVIVSHRHRHAHVQLSDIYMRILFEYGMYTRCTHDSSCFIVRRLFASNLFYSVGISWCVWDVFALWGRFVLSISRSM